MSDETARTEEVAPAVMQSGQVNALAAGASITVVGKVLGRGVDLLKQVLMARLLGPEAFGLYALAWNLLRIIIILAPLGLQNGVTHFGSRFRQSNQGAFKSIYRRALFISLAVSTALAAILFALAPWLANTIFKEPELTAVIRLFVPIIPAMTGMHVVVTTSRVSQRMRYAVYVEEILQPVASLMLFLLLYLLGWKLFGAVVSTVVSVFIAFAAGLIYVRRLFPEMAAAQAKAEVPTTEVMRYSLPTAFSGMFGVLIYRVDRLFIGFFLPAASVGIYQAASQFSIIFAIILNGFNAIFTPMIADLFHQDKMSQLQELYRITTKWSLYLSTPVFLTILVAPVQIMTALYGSAYAEGGAVLFVLTLGQLINSATGPVGMLLIMTGRQNQWFNITAVSLVINLILNWVLIQRIGLVGAAIATAVTTAALFLWGLADARRTLGMWPYDRRYLKGLLAAGIVTIALLAMRDTFDQPIWNVILLAGSATVGFFGLLLLLGLDKEDQEFIQSVWSRIKKV